MLTIAWDVDDILNNLMFEWFLDFKEKNGQLKDCSGINFEDIKENPPTEILGISKSDYLESLDRFRLERAYVSSRPNSEVLKWFEEYGNRANHIALTAVPARCAHASACWVMTHFGKWIRSFNFIPSPREADPVFFFDSGKADFLKRVGFVDFLVEDNPKNVREAEAVGVKGLLVARPWNNGSVNLSDLLGRLSVEIEDDNI